MVRSRLVRSDVNRRRLRKWCAAAMAVLSLAGRAKADESAFVDPPPSLEYSEDGQLVFGDGPPPEMPPPVVIDEPGRPYCSPYEQDVPWYHAFGLPDKSTNYYCRCMTPLGFRHSYTHGRNVGWGWPLGGTSWLNRPYYCGLSLGPMWATRPVAQDVTTDTDLMGAIWLGWDWDYYWGSEFELSRASPELVNVNTPDANRGDRLCHFSYNYHYYPWGDAALRPYWRLGIGVTDFDYPTGNGRHDDTLMTIPWGIGLKYAHLRWLACRIELADYWSPTHAGVANQHNIALNFGVEWRYGLLRKSYWPWFPSSYIP